MTISQAIGGSCHCGNIRYVLHWPEAESVVAVRQCGCTFCSKHGGAWTSHPAARLVVQIDEKSSVSEYRFGTETAEFVICTTCGVLPFVLSEIENRQYAVTNVNTFDDASDLSLVFSTTDFDGEDTASRLKRRERNWIPSVEFV